jgi:hypothetical protein
MKETGVQDFQRLPSIKGCALNGQRQNLRTRYRFSMTVLYCNDMSLVYLTDENKIKM